MGRRADRPRSGASLRGTAGPGPLPRFRPAQAGARRRRWDAQALFLDPRLVGRAGMKALVAETFGTFALVFAGTGAIVINDARGGAVTHVGVALTFGLIVLALIYALGEASGAHLNPAVTLAFCLARRFPA